LFATLGLGLFNFRGIMKLNYTEIDYIRVRPGAGVSITNALHDALLVSATERKNVELIFNDRLYKIDIRDLINYIDVAEDKT
jgi:hypothetical protein